MKNIYKYPLKFTVAQVVKAPIAKVLDIQIQAGVPTLWAIVDDSIPEWDCTIACFGTGTSSVDKYMTSSLQDKYVSTTQTNGYVFHWFID